MQNNTNQTKSYGDKVINTQMNSPARRINNITNRPTQGNTSGMPGNNNVSNSAPMNQTGSPDTGITPDNNGAPPVTNGTGTVPRAPLIYGAPVNNTPGETTSPGTRTPTGRGATPATPMQNGMVPGTRTGAPVGRGTSPAAPMGSPVQNGMPPGTQTGTPAGRATTPTTPMGPPVQNGMPPGTQTGTPAGRATTPTTPMGPPVQNRMTPGAPMGTPMQNGMPQRTPMGTPMQNGMPQRSPMGTPLQNGMPQRSPMGTPMQNGMPQGTSMGTPMQNGMPQGAPMGTPLQNGMPQRAPMGTPMQGAAPPTQAPLQPPYITCPYFPSGINPMYMPGNSQYNVPMGIPLYPMYGYDNSEDLDKDLEYMKQLYPNTAKNVQKEIMNECDRLEYDGSFMYDEYPDKTSMDKIIDHIYEKVKDLEEEPLLETNSIYYYPRRRSNYLRDIVTLVLLNEFFNRRRRYRSRRRWF